MGKKIIGWVMFVLVVAAAIAMTIYMGQGSVSMLIYNFAFMGIMLVVCIAGIIGGFWNMQRLEDSFGRARERISQNFGGEKERREGSVLKLERLFNHPLLDQKWRSFSGYVAASRCGIGDVEDYIGLEEVDTAVHKRLLDMIPDILTSLGILGTFVGLVWGLKNFEPTDYTAMTNSVSALVEGIQVAFLTSIYGLSFSLVYSYNLRSSYSAVTGALDDFLEEFHTHVMPAAEDESRNEMIASQKEQTAAMKNMAAQFSSQLAASFEQVITPAFRKMNDSLDTMVKTLSEGQQEMMDKLLDSFFRQLRGSFDMEFKGFNTALQELTKAQTSAAAYTKELCENLGNELGTLFVEEEKNLRRMVQELGTMQKEYVASSQEVLRENQRLMESQDASYRHLADYMKEAEESSAKFWVACNQAMQKYVNAASAGLEGYVAAGEQSSRLYEANEKLVKSYTEKMKEFVDYQKLVYVTMNHVQSLLSSIAVSSDSKNIYLHKGVPGQVLGDTSQELKKLQELLEEQGARQQELLSDMLQCLQELKNSQKNKKGLFR